MSDKAFTKANLDICLSELGKEYKRRNRHGTPAEIILVGGAAVLAGYGFRDMTYGIDAIIFAASSMKDAINAVGDKLGLPNGWLNADFRRTGSYSDKLPEVSVFYKTFSNVLHVRTVAAEYLVAMKLMSGRQYKKDRSDVAGILLEQQRRNEPIAREAIDAAIAKLYGEHAKLTEATQAFIDGLSGDSDAERVYGKIREQELQAERELLDMGDIHPRAAKMESADSVIEQAKRKRTERPC